MTKIAETIGFIGTGKITNAMVRGLLAEPCEIHNVLVSPRNAEIATGLKSDFSAVTVAADNQSIVDECDLVVLAVRPQIAEEVIRSLRFRDGQQLISVVATVNGETLKDWAGADVTVTRAIPLPFVEERKGVTAIFPPNEAASCLFELLGGAVETETKNEFDLLAAATSLMGTYFGLANHIVGWLAQEGLPAEKGRAFVAPLLAQLAVRAAEDNTTPLDVLSAEFSTKGGLNEQLLRDFHRLGGLEALSSSLNSVLERIQS